MGTQQVILVLIALVAVGVAVFFRLRAQPRWRLVSIRGDFTTEHHLPEVLPVPAAQQARVAAGDFTFEEAVAWIGQFLGTHRRHRMGGQFRLALRKIDFYKQLADYMGRGRWGEVDRLAMQLAELDPLDPSAAVARGRAMRQLGQFASAVQFYQQALKLQPTHSLALPELAATCRAMRQPQRFRKALDAAKQRLGETHPLTIESRVQLGELVRVWADPTDPATVAHIPRQQYIHNVRARMEETEADPGSAMAIVRSMLNDDMPELAEMILERCEQSFGRRAELLAVRGMIAQYEQDPQAARASLEESLRLEDSALGHLELGRVLLDLAHPPASASERHELEQQAHQHLRLAIDRDPNLLEAYTLLVQSSPTNGLRGVMDSIRTLAKAYPEAWAPYRLIGDAHAADNHGEAALRAYENGLSRQRHDMLLLPYVTLLGQMERTRQLLEVADETTDLPRRDPMLRWRIAQAYCDARRLPEARRVLDGLIDDEQAPPLLRQRAREILQQLESGPTPSK